MTDILTDREMQAYRRGKVAGYNAGIVDGWDSAMIHIRKAFEESLAVTLREPELVAEHRKALKARGRD